MPGVNGIYFQAFQPLDTGIRNRQVVHDGIEHWLIRVFEQIAAKQIATGSQDSY
jgi:hypothetical protein